MRLLTRLSLVVLLVIAGSACKHNKNANTTVKQRAAFDLSCAQDDLKLNVLDTEGARKLSSQIAVYGCGQKAVYVYYPDGNTWVIDGIVTPVEEGFEMRASAAEGDRRSSRAEKKGKMNTGEAAPAPEEPEKKKKRRKDD